MNLLLTGCFNYTDSQLSQLAGLGFTIHFMQQESGPLPLPASEVDATVCNGLFLHHSIDEFSRLKLIQLTSAGLDRVPLDSIRRRGIILHNARGVYSAPMAEWAVFRILEHYKHADEFRQNQLGRQWTKIRAIRELTDAKVAIVGAGNVGTEVAKRLEPFGCEIAGYDIHTNPQPHFAEMRLIESLAYTVDKFDIIILTAPLTPQTEGLISSDILSQLRQNAMLVNIARGGLVDEQALIAALRNRPDLFAALDVFATEPLPASSPLWQLPNVAISPHNSFVGHANSLRMFEVILTNLSALISK
ncbi:MAG: NAD(P)-dependent oxidoreductase [Muribaculaceae bacterium]